MLLVKRQHSVPRGARVGLTNTPRANASKKSQKGVAEESPERLPPRKSRLVPLGGSKTKSKSKSPTASRSGSRARLDTFQHVDIVLSEHDPEKAGPANEPIVTEVRPEPKRGWRNFIWDSLDKSPEERRLVQKIDLALLTLGCLSQ